MTTHTLHVFRANFDAALMTPFAVKHRLKHALNALVMKGITRSDLLLIPGVAYVEADTRVVGINEAAPASSSTSTPASASSSVVSDRGVDHVVEADVLAARRARSVSEWGLDHSETVLNTGLDNLHPEFAAVPGVSRYITNLYSCCTDLSPDTSEGSPYATHFAGEIQNRYDV